MFEERSSGRPFGAPSRRRDIVGIEADAAETNSPPRYLNQLHTQPQVPTATGPRATRAHGAALDCC